MLNMNLVDAVLYHDTRTMIMTHDFENISFHDNAIHGIFLPENIDGRISPLRFDIDHIIEWSEDTFSGKPLFSVCQAVVSFSDVTDLKVNIEWAESKYTASETGLYIIDINKINVKTMLRFPHYYKLEIITNNKNCYFSFGASTFSMSLLGDTRLIGRQYLLGEERASILQLTDK